MILPAPLPGDRPRQAKGVEVLNPGMRVPVSLIIDDSTALVNLAHFCIPQFGEVFPDQFLQPWRELPREIPDAFVRRFGEWCHEHGVKGKYSMVPYPACVGWLDRDLPGWSKRELNESLDLVRTLLTPDWDIHPEMISHTWIIDPKTGRSHPERTAHFMENWWWTNGRSTDELTEYMSYALTILKNVGLHCDGITTPGGFADNVRPQLSQASLESVRSVFRSEIPHYFRHLYTDERSVAPRVEYASGLDGPDPRCVISIIGCTGDWFGGWDGLERGHPDQCITEDGQGGRLPEVIGRGEPAILVCHWPGVYYNGQEVGFDIFKEVVRRLHTAYDHLIWMKLSEISRYWAARELTGIEQQGQDIVFRAPFACPQFTLRLAAKAGTVPRLTMVGQPAPLKEVIRALDLQSQPGGGTWYREGATVLACFDLPKGESRVSVEVGV